MIEVIYSPDWFYGKDIIIDVISILVLVLIGFFSWRYHTIDKRNAKYKMLAVAFWMIALSYLFKTLMNFSIYYHIVETEHLGFVDFTTHQIIKIDNLFFIGFLVFRLLSVFGLYMLYSLYQPHSRSNAILILSLLGISVIFTSASYYVFHLTALVILFLITYELMQRSKETHAWTTRLIALSFGVIMVSQLVFMVVRLDLPLYALAEGLQLAGYIGILVGFIGGLMHGKKAIKA